MKPKFFQKNEKYEIIEELQRCKMNHVTHIVNMHGSFRDILKYSRIMGICVVDTKLQQYIANKFE